MGFRKDLTNKVFGKYTVLEYAGSSKWLCKCTCGTLNEIRTSDLNSGNSKGCRKCTNRLEKRGLAGFNRLYLKYKSRSKRFSQSFDISEKLFEQLTSSNCHYCGSKPSGKSFNENTSRETIEHGTYTFNGLDRLDSSKGYFVENVVPCCITCNRAKNKMSYKEFKDYIKQLVNFNK